MRQLTANDFDGMTFSTVTDPKTVYTLHANQYPGGIRFHVGNTGPPYSPYSFEVIDRYIKKGLWVPTKRWVIKQFLKQVEQCLQST